MRPEGMKLSRLALALLSFLAGAAVVYVSHTPDAAVVLRRPLDPSVQELSLAQALQLATKPRPEVPSYPHACSSQPSWLCSSVLVTNMDGTAASAFLAPLMLSIRLARLEDMAHRLLVDCLDTEAYALCRQLHVQPALCLRTVSQSLGGMGYRSVSACSFVS